MAIGRYSPSNINWVNLVAGIWLIVSPYVLAYTALVPAVVNNLAVGILLILIAAYVLFTHKFVEWMGWAVAVLGIWEIIAPFVLGFDGEVAPLWNNIILGIAITVVGLWSARTAWGETQVPR